MGSENLGAAYVGIGADLGPLRAGLKQAQRETNSAVARMTNAAASFAKPSAGVLGLAGGATALAGAGAAIGITTLIKESQALISMASAAGSVAAKFDKMRGAAGKFHSEWSKKAPLREYETFNAATTAMEQGLITDPAKLTSYLEAAVGLMGLKGNKIGIEETMKDIMQAVTTLGGAAAMGLKYSLKLPADIPPEKLEAMVLGKAKSGLAMHEKLKEHPLMASQIALAQSMDKLGNAFSNLLPFATAAMRWFNTDNRNTPDSNRPETPDQIGWADKLVNWTAEKIAGMHPAATGDDRGTWEMRGKGWMRRLRFTPAEGAGAGILGEGAAPFQIGRDRAYGDTLWDNWALPSGAQQKAYLTEDGSAGAIRDLFNDTTDHYPYEEITGAAEQMTNSATNTTGDERQNFALRGHPAAARDYNEGDPDSDLAMITRQILEVLRTTRSAL